MRSWMVMVVLMLGCAVTLPPEKEIEMPELVSQVPLPALSRKLQGKPLRLELKIHIAEDGSVRQAEFASPSGDPEWDHQALARVRQWKFAPARQGDRPIAIWIRQSILLQFTDELRMFLAEIRCRESSLADSLYEALVAGSDFSDLARRFSVGPTAAEGGLLGELDIRTFPYAIQQQLRNLRPGEYTRPLRIGHESVVFLRLGQINESPGPAARADVPAVPVLRMERV